MKHRYMPISVSLKDRPCLIVGGGLVALRKVETLLDYETSITVVAPQVHEKLEYHAKQGRITLEKREYESPEAASYGLVVSATDNAALTRQPIVTHRYESVRSISQPATGGPTKPPSPAPV